jgi:hypothetical protein
MKKQTGIRVEAELWDAYRELCKRQKLWPSQPIEDFLRLVVDEGSAVSLLRLMHESAMTRTEGHEVFARVLLDWYTHDKFWIDGSGDKEVSVETRLLDALKTVADPELRSIFHDILKATKYKVANKTASKFFLALQDNVL